VVLTAGDDSVTIGAANTLVASDSMELVITGGAQSLTFHDAMVGAGNTFLVDASASAASLN